jgi:pilus assembly protein CpaF
MEEGKVIGRLKPTGIRPKFMDEIEAAGIRLSASTFGLGERLRY